MHKIILIHGLIASTVFSYPLSNRKDPPLSYAHLFYDSFTKPSASEAWVSLDSGTNHELDYPTSGLKLSEPPSIALFSLGLMALGVLKRRKNIKQDTAVNII
jgi:hypothetical protein